MRASSLLILLKSVKEQSLYPNEIIVIDASTNLDTKLVLEQNNFGNLQYFSVDAANRGLTKQRNFGISKVSSRSDIVCFLDDDTVLESNYFENLLNTYSQFPNSLGVGGIITNEVTWQKASSNYKNKINEFYFDGWFRNEGLRFVIRKFLRLDTNKPPGWMPSFSNGRSLSFLPPSNKVYEVEQLMGGVSSFRKEVFDKIQFSIFFQGYGLYEDADFTLRLAKFGKLYCNTAARLAHFHDASGRPNQFQYGKMVVRNGWYVWRVRYPKPDLKSRIKWNLISLLLIKIRFFNVFTTSKKKEAFTETLGRLVGWFSLILQKPKIKK
jgi:GT2 family glycosyltransferase